MKKLSVEQKKAIASAISKRAKAFYERKKILSRLQEQAELEIMNSEQYAEAQRLNKERDDRVACFKAKSAEIVSKIAELEAQLQELKEQYAADGEKQQKLRDESLKHLREYRNQKLAEAAAGYEDVASCSTPASWKPYTAFM